MKGFKKTGGRGVRLAGASVLLVLLNAVSLSEAQIYTMNDNNSSAQVNPSSSQGMLSWQIDGNNYLNQQWFWYRTTAVGAASPINTISAPVVTTPYGPNGRALSTVYSTTGYSVEVDYLLTGGAPMISGVSDIGETITINNNGATTLSFHLFQYSDFNLSAALDTVQLGKNLRGLFNEAYQAGPNPNQKLTETVVTPGANHGEAALVGATLAEMAGAGFTTLSDAVGPVGPADVTWAFEWDLSIAPGGSAIISKDKYLSVGAVPEPSTVAVLSLGLVAYALRRRQKQA